MINIKFSGNKYKIFANGNIKCLGKCSQEDFMKLKDTVQMITETYDNPSDGFPVSRMAGLLPEYGIKVVSYRDYEMENAACDTIY